MTEYYGIQHFFASPMATEAIKVITKTEEKS